MTPTKCIRRVNGRWCSGRYETVRQFIVRCSECGHEEFNRDAPIGYHDEMRGTYQPLGVIRTAGEKAE